MRAATAAAVRLGNGGFTTILDGIVGPWHFDVVRDELASCSVSVSYVALRCWTRGRAPGRRRVPNHRLAGGSQTQSGREPGPGLSHV